MHQCCTGMLVHSPVPSDCVVPTVTGPPSALATAAPGILARCTCIDMVRSTACILSHCRWQWFSQPGCTSGPRPGCCPDMVRSLPRQLVSDSDRVHAPHCSCMAKQQCPWVQCMLVLPWDDQGVPTSNSAQGRCGHPPCAGCACAPVHRQDLLCILRSGPTCNIR